MQSDRTFRLFVSSTFDDFKAERGALQRLVFPRLRELCEAYGCRFQAIDLRWGISEEAALDQRTVSICLDEIDRCQRTSLRPHFLILLGDRYGWRPLPYEIPSDEFDRIAGHVSNPMDLALVRHWYQRDDNAIPPCHVLQPRASEYVNSSRWLSIETQLRDVLLRGAQLAHYTNHKFPKYGASATELEIVRGALTVRDARDHVLCLLRSIPNLPRNAVARAYLDFDDCSNVDRCAASRLLALKTELKNHLGSNVREFEASWTGTGITTDHLDALCDETYKSLSTVLQRQFATLTAFDPLDTEIHAHLHFGDERARHFVGRLDQLSQVFAYISAKMPTPLVVTGVAGCGKSAVMAFAAQQTRMQYPDAVHILRFIGASAASSELRSLVEGLCREIAREYRSAEDTVLPSEYEELVRFFKDLLKAASAERPLIVFIDALDQLVGDRTVNWLTTMTLPRHVRLVISRLDEGSVTRDSTNRLARKNLPVGRWPRPRRWIDQMWHRPNSRGDDEGSNNSASLTIPPLPPAAAAELLEQWMHQAGRTLQLEQRDAILAAFNSSGMPLHLRFLFEEARRWRSYEHLPERADGSPVLRNDTLGQIQSLFHRLERDHSQQLVSRALGYIGAARHGLAEDELVDVLARDDDFVDDFRSRARHEMPADNFDRPRLPIAIWARLHSDLEPYITQRSVPGATVFAFYHRQVLDAVVAQYLGNGRRQSRNAVLAGYFSCQPTWTVAGTRPNSRKGVELPYNLARAEHWQALTDVLFEPSFQKAKCAAGLLSDLISDYEIVTRAESAIPEAQALLAVGHALRLSAHVISREPEHFAAQLHGRLASDVRPAVRRYLTRLTNEKPWLRPLTTSLGPPGQSLLATLPGPEFTSGVLSLALAPDDTRLMVGYGGRFWNLKLWDIQSGSELLDFVGHGDMVTAVAISSDGRRALSCASSSVDGSVRLWDLHTGAALRVYRPIVVRLLQQRWVQAVPLAGPIANATWQESVRAIAIMPDGRRAVFGMRKRIKIWDMDEWRCIHTLKGRQGSINALTVTCDGQYIVSGGDDGTLTLWDVARRRPIRRLRGHTDGIEDVLVTPDNRYIVSASLDRTIRIWDLLNGIELHILKNHASTVSHVALTSDGTRIVSTSLDHTLSQWDLESGRLLDTIEDSSLSGGLVIVPGRSRAISGSMDGSLKIWNLSIPINTVSIPAHRTPVGALVRTARGNRIITSGIDGSLKTWDLQNCREMIPRGTRFSEANRFMSSWDFMISKRGNFEGEFFSRLGGVAITPDGRQALSGSLDGSLRLWDLESCRELWTLEGHSKAVTGVVITPDGRRAVSAAGDKTLKLWHLSNGQELHAFSGHAGWIHSLAISPDGDRVISGSAGRLELWDIKNRCHLRSIEIEHSWGVPIIFLSGNMVLSAAGGSIVWWDLSTGSKIRSFYAHPDINGLAITAAGTRLLSVSKDKTSRLWDLEREKELARFIGDAPFWCCHVGRDDDSFVVGDVLGRVHFLRFETELRVERSK